MAGERLREAILRPGGVEGPAERRWEGRVLRGGTLREGDPVALEPVGR